MRDDPLCAAMKRQLDQLSDGARRMSPVPVFRRYLIANLNSSVLIGRSYETTVSDELAVRQE
jgi:hypothetical protein